MFAGVAGFLALLLGRGKKKKVTTFFEDDFENYPTNWSPIVGGGASITKTAAQRVKNGYSARLLCPLVADQLALVPNVVFPTVVFPLHVKFWIYINDVSATTNNFSIEAGNNATNSFNLRLNSLGGGSYQLLNIGVSLNAVVVDTLSRGVWYRIDAYYSGNTLRYFVNGVDKGLFEIGGDPNNWLLFLSFNAETFAGTCDLYLDDVLVEEGLFSPAQTSDVTTSVVSAEFTRLRTVRHLSTLSPLII